MTKVKYSFAQWCVDNSHKDWLDLWDYELNGVWPDEVSYSSGIKRWFKCKRDTHKSEQKTLSNLVSGRAKLFCKQCQSFGQHLLDVFGNNAIELYWSEKNIISPFDIAKMTKANVWIKCIDDSKHPDYLIKAINFWNFSGCPTCRREAGDKRSSCVAITHPDCVRYFTNQDDAYRFSSGQECKISVTCPDCGHAFYKTVYDLTYRPFNCPRCGDGSSYPSKFVYEFLLQLQKKYCFDIRTEHVFEWSKKLGKNQMSCKRYDFYLEGNGHKIIVEVHGQQHYDDSFYKYGHSATYEQSNDEYKKNLALLNGISTDCYIEIDARKSNADWIRNSIINCGIHDILNFDETIINWKACDVMACKSLVKTASDLWNTGEYKISDLAKMLRKSRATIIDYLKKANNLGWCSYHPDYDKFFKKKPLICIDNGYVFASVRDCVQISDKIFGQQFDDKSLYMSLEKDIGILYGLHFTRITQEEFLQIQRQYPERTFGKI